MAFRNQGLGINTELRGARGVITNLNAIAKALDTTRLAATKTFQIDAQIRRLGVQTGATAAQFRRLTMATAGLTQATGVSIDKTTALVNAYQAAGQSLDHMSTRAHDATNGFAEMSTEGAKNLRMMTELTGRFGIAAGAAVKMQRTIGHLVGEDGFEALLDSTTRFQKQFNMPGLIGQLPRVVGFAQSSLSRFGASVAGNSLKIMQDTTRIGASFAKAFGVDAAEGINKAIAAQSRFFQQTRADQDVFLGLGDSFDPLTNALFETGMGFERIQEMTRLGREDPIAYARQIRSMFEQLGGESSLYARRFLENVRRNSSESIQELITNEKALRDAAHERDEALKTDASLESFSKLAESTRSIGAELLTTISNLANLGKTIIGLTFVEDFSEPLKGGVEIIQRFNRWLVETVHNVRESDIYKWLRPKLQGIAKFLITIGQGARVLAETFASMLIPATTFVSLFGKVPVVGSGTLKIFSKLQDMFVSFVKGTVKPLAILGGIGSALNDFGKALKDPSLFKRPLETMVRVFRAASVGVVDVFDNLLFGLPTKIMKWFYPEMRGTLTDVVKRLFTDLQIWLIRRSSQMGINWWDAFHERAQAGLQQFYAWLNGRLNVWHTYAEEWGKNIGRAIGTLAHWAWEKISPLFRVETWSEGWDSIVNYFKGQGRSTMVTGMGSALSGVLGVVGTFTRNMIDEMLRPWGKGWLEVSEGFSVMWDRIKVGFAWFQNVGIRKMEAKWLDFKLNAVETFLSIKDTVSFAFDATANTVMYLVSKVKQGVNAIKASYYAMSAVANKAMALAIKAAAAPALAGAYASDALGATKGAAARLEASLGITSFENSANQAAISGGTALALALAAGNQAEGYQNALENMPSLQDRGKARTAFIAENYAGDQTRRDLLNAKAQTVNIPGMFGMPGMSFQVFPEGSIAQGEQSFNAARRPIEQERARRQREEFFPARDMRDAERRTELANRTQQFQQANALKGPYIERTGQILDRLQAEAARRPPDQRAGIQRVIDHVNDASRGIADANDPRTVVDRWNQMLQYLNRYGGLTEALGRSGVEGLSPAEYGGGAPAPGTAPGRMGTAPEPPAEGSSSPSGGSGSGGSDSVSMAPKEMYHHIIGRMSTDGFIEFFSDNDRRAASDAGVA